MNELLKKLKSKKTKAAFKQGFELFLELSKTLGLDPKSRLTLEYFQDGSGGSSDAYVPGVNGSYVVEAKAPRRDGRIDLSGWLREADTEADNYMNQKKLKVRPTPLVIIKASNKGIGEAYVVQRLSDVLPNL